jgi:hypothetical protein
MEGHESILYQSKDVLSMIIRLVGFADCVSLYRTCKGLRAMLLKRDLIRIVSLKLIASNFQSFSSFFQCVHEMLRIHREASILLTKVPFKYIRPLIQSDREKLCSVLSANSIVFGEMPRDFLTDETLFENVFKIQLENEFDLDCIEFKSAWFSLCSTFHQDRTLFVFTKARIGYHLPISIDLSKKDSEQEFYMSILLTLSEEIISCGIRIH